MSLLWPERLALAIYPGRIAWLRAGGWRTRVLHKGETPFAAHDSAALSTAFSSVLEQAGKPGRVDIVLSNTLVRYTTVANPDNARNLAERNKLAAHAFARIHGKPVEGWRIRLSHAAPGKPALASAVDAALIELLHEAASARRSRIASLRPYLMAAFNPYRRRLSGAAGLFAVAEPGRLCIASWQDGGWAAVQQSHWEPSGDLGAALARAGAVSGLAGEAPAWLYAAECRGLERQSRPDSLPVNWTAGLSPTQDFAWGGALLGLGD